MEERIQKNNTDRAIEERDPMNVLDNFECFKRIDSTIDINEVAISAINHEAAASISDTLEKAIRLGADINKITEKVNCANDSYKLLALLQHGADPDTVLRKIDPLSIYLCLETIIQFRRFNPWANAEEIQRRIILFNIDSLLELGCIKPEVLAEKLTHDQLRDCLGSLLDHNIDRDAFFQRLNSEMICKNIDKLLEYEPIKPEELIKKLDDYDLERCLDSIIDHNVDQSVYIDRLKSSIVRHNIEKLLEAGCIKPEVLVEKLNDRDLDVCLYVLLRHGISQDVFVDRLNGWIIKGYTDDVISDDINILNYEKIDIDKLIPKMYDYTIIKHLDELKARNAKSSVILESLSIKSITDHMDALMGYNISIEEIVDTIRSKMKNGDESVNIHEGTSTALISHGASPETVARLGLKDPEDPLV